MDILRGNTFPIKDLIKAKGGKWDPSLRAWRVPTEHYEELSALTASSKSETYGYMFECLDCGDDVYRGSQCWETGLTH